VKNLNSQHLISSRQSHRQSSLSRRRSWTFSKYSSFKITYWEKISRRR